LQAEIRRIVKKNSEYVIRFSELKDDTETFEFLLGDSFFQAFKSNDWENGFVEATVTVVKRPDGITIDLKMNGELTVTCDRCLDTFQLPVDFLQRLYVQYGQEPEELDDNIVVVAREDNQIDLASFFYEYLVLSIPVKRVHPVNSSGNSGCNKEMLEKLEEHIIDKNIEKGDPRWDDLKKLIDKN
jgi:uncharacterized metal-binding protein YceD (DUF177 family)